MDDETLLSADRVLLLGRQGAGKSLVGRLLAGRLDSEFFSMGEVLREAAHGDTEDAREIRRLLDAGHGLPPALSYGLLEAALAARAHDGPLIIDGIPRLADQVGRVRELLGQEPTAVVVLDVPTPIAIDRLMSRVLCEACGWPHGPGWPSSDGRCTGCGSALAARPDDTAAGIARRLETWRVHARPITRYYEGLGVLRTVRADTPASDVVQAVIDALAG